MNFNFAIIFENWSYLMSGLRFSLMLTAIAFVFGLLFGICLALLQHLNIRGGAQFARAYVAIMRSIPLIMVLFWFFFLVPIIMGQVFNNGRPMPIGGFWTAIITFCLFEAAYYSEIIRVGLRSLNKGQFESSKALSLSTFQTYRYIILPQVLRICSPIILSQTIILFQDTSLVYVMSLTDFVGAASKLAQLNNALVELYIFVAIVYLIICVIASQLVAYLKRRTQIIGR